MPKDIEEDVADAEELNGPDDLDAGPDADIDELDDDEDEDDVALLDDDDDALADDDEPEGDTAVEVLTPRPVAEPEESATEEEDDEELDDDDVEASLDVILKERLVVEDEEEDEDEDEPADVEDRTDGGLRVLPKQPGEFVCQSCFLVKNESQLADPARGLCRDCV